jgi:hypothetical protein
VLHDPQATDRISAVETLCKIGATDREDRAVILEWLKTADDATAAFPLWFLVLSSNSSERESDEAALAKLLSSQDGIARLRAGEMGISTTEVGSRVAEMVSSSEKVGS